MSNKTTFTDYITPIVAAWLNDVNTTTFVALADGANNPPTTATQVKSNLGLVINTNIAPATSGSSVLKANGTGGFSNATGTDITTLIAANNVTNATNATNVTGTISSGATATTQSAGDSSTKVATTAFVMGQAVIGTANTPGIVSLIDYTIPTWAKRIIISYIDISTDGTSDYTIQLGTGGVPETTGYIGQTSVLGTSTLTTSVYNTNGLTIVNTPAAAGSYSGQVILCLVDASTNTWSCSSSIARTTSTNLNVSAGYKSLAGTLNMIRLTTTGGANTFDAGKVNIQYN